MLLVRSSHNKKMWQFPGGKPIGDESDYECLVREISEEIPDFHLSHAVYFNTLHAHTPYAGDKRAFVLFLMSGNGGITPGGEIAETRWMDRGESGAVGLAEAAEQAVKICIRRRWL